MQIIGKMLAGAVLATIGMVAPGGVSAQGFDPATPCGSSLRAASDEDKLLIAAWFYGYIAAQNRDVRALDRAGMVALLNNVFTACGDDETRSLLALLQGSDTGGAEGSRDSAEQLLQQFLDPGADLVALTAALAPNAEDINAVYGDPLATRLVDMYAGMFVAGARIGPKPEHDALLIVHTTTASLKSGDAVLDEFPGGYRKITQYIVGDFPIVRFKFVTAGQDIGLAFDGLIHVNGRWVLMPKPWRALQ